MSLTSDSETDPALLLSRLADAADKIAKQLEPKPDPPGPPLMTVDTEVVSSQVSDNNERCVTYVVASPDRNALRHVSLSIRFLLERDPLWRAGQKLKISVTD